MQTVSLTCELEVLLSLSLGVHGHFLICPYVQLFLKAPVFTVSLPQGDKVKNEGAGGERTRPMLRPLAVTLGFSGEGLQQGRGGAHSGSLPLGLHLSRVAAYCIQGIRVLFAHPS